MTKVDWPEGWSVQEVGWPRSVADAARAYADGAELAWLDSAASVADDPRGGRYSLIATRPVACVEQFEGAPAVLSRAGRPIAEALRGWGLWRRALRGQGPRAVLPTGIGPGWIGYLGFEMARELERLPATCHETLGLPLLRMSLFDRAILLDHQEHCAWAVRARGAAADLDLPPRERDRDWRKRWEAAAAIDGLDAARQHVVAELQTPQRVHEGRVSQALDYIAAGDIYQVNIAHRIALSGLTDPLAAYAQLRRVNPAPYAALLGWDDAAVLSVSPELMLALRGGQVRTCPIKGTRPRTGDPETDARHVDDLLRSAKEAAELTMIVDLHRNDLGRVCRYGSVRVADPRRLETHPSVFHTVADVVGALAPGQDALHLLAACFPAGSISGVPKIRALEIIDELEDAARGVYTGAIGVLGLDGQMTFNVAIRTVQMHAGQAALHVGGGIVADSEPAAEYAETLAKARGILRGLHAVGDPITVAR
jgi:anthranilate/para-aminobenzoate synthase component I